jgi:hypothetical protein
LFFYKFWAGQAKKYTLGVKFGGLGQRWGRDGLEEGRVVANHGEKGPTLNMGALGGGISHALVGKPLQIDTN